MANAWDLNDLLVMVRMPMPQIPQAARTRLRLALVLSILFITGRRICGAGQSDRSHRFIAFRKPRGANNSGTYRKVAPRILRILTC
ncbi:MAG: hypothetical protein P4L33_06055 [Capsulimonadaceae bacterium]|nr:hypothetical protein [Capsulimonadaceae bacterium]